jgi:hypothetical protein
MMKALLFLLMLLVGHMVPAQSQKRGVIQVKKQSPSNSSSTEIFIDPIFEDDYILAAQFIGGYAALSSFVKQNLRQPENSRYKGLNQEIVVSVTVQPDSTVTDLKITKGMAECKACEEEALRVAALTTKKWVPGRQKRTGVLKPTNALVNVRFKYLQ